VKSKLGGFEMAEPLDALDWSKETAAPNSCDVQGTNSDPGSIIDRSDGRLIDPQYWHRVPALQEGYYYHYISL
jgi:hypothetical protein